MNRAGSNSPRNRLFYTYNDDPVFPVRRCSILPMNSAGLSIIDWAILLLYAAATIWLGWHFGKKQKSAKEFFTGSGKMNPPLIGVSLFASLLSTITYLSLPGEVTGKGPAFLIRYLSYPLDFLVVARSCYPFVSQQDNQEAMRQPMLTPMKPIPKHALCPHPRT